MDMETGKHVNIPGIEIIPVRAIRLEPLDNPTQGAGIMTMDGEMIPTGMVQAHILPSAAKVFVK
jgi:diacylglycerol kinase family enzyme